VGNIFSRFPGQVKLDDLPFPKTVKGESQKIGAVKENFAAPAAADESESVRINDVLDPSLHGPGLC